MKKVLESIKGLSLTEVLVSITIVLVLSVYGISFFEAAWKYRADNDEYQTVLNNVASNLESSKYCMGDGRLFETETLGSDKTVFYNVAFPGSDIPNLQSIISSATVVHTNNGSAVTEYKIAVKTFVYKKWEKIS